MPPYAHSEAPGSCRKPFAVTGRSVSRTLFRLRILTAVWNTAPFPAATPRPTPRPRQSALAVIRAPLWLTRPARTSRFAVVNLRVSCCHLSGKRQVLQTCSNADELAPCPRVGAEQLNESGPLQEAYQRPLAIFVAPVPFEVDEEDGLPGAVAAWAALHFGEVDVARGLVRRGSHTGRRSPWRVAKTMLVLLYRLRGAWVVPTTKKRV